MRWYTPGLAGLFAAGTSRHHGHRAVGRGGLDHRQIIGTIEILSIFTDELSIEGEPLPALANLNLSTKGSSRCSC